MEKQRNRAPSPACLPAHSIDVCRYRITFAPHRNSLLLLASHCAAAPYRRRAASQPHRYHRAAGAMTPLTDPSFMKSPSSMRGAFTDNKPVLQSIPSDDPAIDYIGRWDSSSGAGKTARW